MRSHSTTQGGPAAITMSVARHTRHHATHRSLEDKPAPGQDRKVSAPTGAPAPGYRTERACRSMCASVVSWWVVSHRSSSRAAPRVDLLERPCPYVLGSVAGASGAAPGLWPGSVVVTSMIENACPAA